MRRWLPSSLGHRFALAAAGLAVAALALTSLASWWLINRQHERALQQLAVRERQFRAAAVGSDLHALAGRMSEIAGSTILATGLVDSAGRETYLAPFLSGIRQINGIPVQVVFTDFQGVEIATNGGARFSPEQVVWLRRMIDAGQPASTVFESPAGPELVALEPMVYARTSSPEGAVLYKVALRDLKLGPSIRLEWGPARDAAAPDATSTPVPGPPAFEHLKFRVRAADPHALDATRPALPYLHIVGITLALFSIVVLAGLRLARLLTGDLQRLESFSRGLLGSGLSTERAPEGGSTEVSSLARSINDMLERLNQQNLTLLQEQEKLTRLTQALQENDRKKDAFLAMLGHELRNPLAPISAGAELLRKLPSTDARVGRTSEVIARQVAHMTKIVSDLLDVSRVTRGLIRLDKTEVELGEVIRAAVEQVRPLIESRDHALTVSLPDEPLVVLGDPARLVQVMSNLLTNAAKYTPDAGRIELTVKGAAGQATVEVRDNGVGIPAELMPEIFELFTQGSREADRSQGGLGLGLALVKHLTELHGGTVGVVSDGAGQGSTFTIRLPRPALSVGVARPSPAVSQPERLLSILVVDDNVDAADTLAHWLALEGHTVAVANNGTSALDQAERRHFDAFILDIGLPGMDGTELARRLKAGHFADEALLIALTGYGLASDREKSAAAGFDHHLVKPVDPQVLRSVLLRSPHAPIAVM